MERHWRYWSSFAKLKVAGGFQKKRRSCRGLQLVIKDWGVVTSGALFSLEVSISSVGHVQTACSNLVLFTQVHAFALLIIIKINIRNQHHCAVSYF